MQIITSKDNKIVKYISLLNSSPKERKKSGMFIAEGLRLCNEASINNTDIRILLLSEKFVEKHPDVSQALSEKAGETYYLADSLFEKISDTKTPQGVMCICSVNSLPALDIDNKKKYIALENVGDPLNMGTIFRTADALGIDGIILSDNCCEFYSPKVVRGSMGAIFRIPTLITDNMSMLAQELTSKGFTTLAAVVSEHDLYITDTELSEGTIIFIGNEANGLTPETSHACKHKVTIPMNGHAESLNAAMAAGILMWEMVRDRGSKNG